nr:uncharacterized protein LOC115263650 [Aedes albopictus]
MTLLETVVLNIVDDHGQKHKARALLDSASMSNFISKPLAKNLYSRRSPVDVSVAGIGSSTQKISSAITATIESGDRTISMKLQFLVLKQPSSDLPTMPIDISAWKLPNVQLADPQFNVPGSVDLVIGSETYWETPHGTEEGLPWVVGEGLPWVVETPFGWAVTGPASRSATCIPRLCYLSTADDRLEVALRKLWDMETTPSKSRRYIVRLPRTEERRWASNAQEVLQDVSPEDLNVQPLHEQPSNHLKITPPVFVWSDSSTVLQWLRASPTQWKTFVANRVSKIQNTTCIDHWRHIAGFENPADDFSRELNPADILNSSRRCQGPSWLTLVPDCWPKIIIDGANSPTVSEEGRKTPVVAMTTAQTTFCGDVRSRYSRYNKLRREAAFRSRYRHRLKERAQLHRSRSNIAELSVSNQRKPPPVPPLTTAELQHAEHPFRMTHPAGFSDLGNDDRIAKSSALKLLKPFIDEGGTLRTGARLRNAAPSTAYKHPIVLLAEHPLSALLASSLHVSLLHAGTTTPASHSPSEVLDPWRQKFCKVRLPPKPHLFPIQAHTAEHSRSAGLAGFAVESAYRVWSRLLRIVLREDSRLKSWPYRSLRGHFHLLQSARRYRSRRLRQHQGGQCSARKLAAGKTIRHLGKDGIVRVVPLRTATDNEVVRPVARIALLYHHEQ